MKGFKNLIAQNINLINGILGTISFHLLFVLLFFSIKLHKVTVQEKEMFLLEFEEEQIPLEKIEQDLQELKEKIATASVSNEKKSNIAASVDREVAKELSTEEYLKELMDELNIDDLNPEHSTALPTEEKIEEQAEQEEIVEHNKLTRISYKLGERKKLRIPAPLFKCEKGGIVIIDIVVNQLGRVTQARLSKETISSDPCLVQEALLASRKSYFQKGFQQSETGYISYEFVAQ